MSGPSDSAGGAGCDGDLARGMRPQGVRQQHEQVHHRDVGAARRFHRVAPARVAASEGRRPHPGRALRRGAARRARCQTRGELRPGAVATGWQSAAQAVRGERAVLAARPPTDRRSGRRASEWWARCGVVRRQLPHHRRGSARSPPRPAPRLRPGTAQARRRAARGLSPCVRAGAGTGRPHRQRARRGAVESLRPRLPEDGNPHDRRALGAADDVPAGVAGKSPATGRADDLGVGRAPARRSLGGRGLAR